MGPRHQLDYRKFSHLNVGRAHEIHERGRDTHGNLYELLPSLRLSYNVTKDLTVGVTQAYRYLRMRNIHGSEHEDDGDEEAPDPVLGRRETSKGFSDLVFDVKWRFKKQTEKGFPVDLAVFASLKPPSGNTQKRNPGGERFEAEDQPGTGSWNGTIGLAASRTWDGGAWGASGSVAHTFKGEGTQQFKAGDSTALALSGSRRLTSAKTSYRVYASLGVQGILEMKARQDGLKSPDHGGQTVFVVPGISAQPVKRLTLSVNATAPVYQELNGFHQEQAWGMQFHAGIRF